VRRQRGRGRLLLLGAKGREDGGDEGDDEDDDDLLVRVPRRGGRRGRAPWSRADDGSEAAGSSDASRPRRGGGSAPVLDDDEEEDEEDDYYSDDFDEEDDDYDEDEDDDDWSAFDPSDIDAKALLEDVVIPNPLLDSIDPDGAADRFPELAKDPKFWIDMALFVAFLNFLSFAGPRDPFPDLPWF
jgi:hypothetical protein